ncbi:MAG TPA: alkaline phosphatase family protein [Draconibacterium sp.]|nr:alkaline phosphatase family protein [Draconibacterium sp.]
MAKFQTGKTSLIILLFFLSYSFPVLGQLLPEIMKTQVSLPNGWKLSPVGELLPLGDLPLNIAVSSSGNMLAVTNNGQSTQSIQLFDSREYKLLDLVVIGKSWLGLTFPKDEKLLYASGGNDNWIIRYQIKNKKLWAADTIILGEPWPNLISVAGIAVDDKRQLLYAVTKENNSLYVVGLEDKKIQKQIPLGGEAYTCLLSNDQKTLYITCWGCDKVILFDTQKQEISGSIPVGDNPNDMCTTKNDKFLFVSNANDNSVSVISLGKKSVVEVLNTALYPAAPQGSTANSVALSEDEKTLYIANADNNCLAVFDVSEPGESFSKGFIPTGWYPTSVRVIGENIFVANGKGLTSKANPLGPSPVDRNERVEHHKDVENAKVQYIGGLFTGTLQKIEIPDERQLGIYSQAVYQNVRYNKETEMVSEGEEGNPVPTTVGQKSPIKYVFYVIKENRTYDQVLGDIPEGNGDTSLVLFGKEVTPNQHALTEQFVLLDNFYVDGEVSADGHNWTMGAYATDYLEKNWPSSYGGRGGFYPGEGGREIANGKVFLWDVCKKYGVSYRSYGEFIGGKKPNIPVLEGHFCEKYVGWDMSIRDTVRFRWWKEDFEKLLAEGKVPQFNSLRFGNDHTEGLSIGKTTPKAHAADNDLAVGMFVEYLSHSPIWNETLIIILEDDAQNGPDHVDAHRTTAYIAGGFVKQGYVDHTMYSTSSALRTIELILGLPPMSQYDASAEPMWRCFNKTATHPPFNAVPNQINLDLKNTEETALSKLSETFNFKKEDSIPDDLFNKVIWAAIKGEDSPCPAPVHAAFLSVSSDEDDDD